MGEKEPKDASERKDPGASKGSKGLKVVEEPQEAVFYVQVFFSRRGASILHLSLSGVAFSLFIDKVLLVLRILVFRVKIKTDVEAAVGIGIDTGIGIGSSTYC